MNPRIRWLTLVAVVAVAMVAVFWSRSPQPPAARDVKTPPSPAPERPGEVSVSPPALPPPPSRASVGITALPALASDYWRGHYDVHYQVAIEGPDPTGQRQQGALSIDADLTVVEAPELGQGWYAARIENPRIDASPNMMSMYGLDAEQPSHGVSGVFTFRLEEDTLVDRRYAPEMTLASRTLAAVITSGFQLTSPDDAAGHLPERWVVEELGLSSPLEVTYERRRDGALFKTWRVSAHDGVQPDGGGSHGSVTLSLVDDRLEAGHWRLESRTDLGAELAQMDTETTAAAASLVYAVDARARLTRSSDVHAAFDPRSLTLGQLERAFYPQATGGNEASKRVRPERDVNTLIAVAAESELTQDFQTRRAALRDLVMHAEADPAVVDQLHTILGQDASPDARRTLVEALASVPTPQSRRAMGALLTTGASPPDVQRAVARVTSFVEAPGVDLLTSLDAAAFDDEHPAHVDALWALAAQGHQLRDSEPELARRIEHDIVSRATAQFDTLKTETLTVSFGPPQRGRYQTWMSALGNLGGAPLYDPISSWLAHEDEYVRATAVESLRFVESVEASSAIRLAMSDPSPTVQRMAVEIAGYYPSDMMAPHIITALESATDGDVKIAAAQRLAAWGEGTSPQLFDHVRAAAARETDDDVRRMLVGFLPEKDINPRGQAPTDASSPSNGSTGPQRPTPVIDSGDSTHHSNVEVSP